MDPAKHPTLTAREAMIHITGPVARLTICSLCLIATTAQADSSASDHASDSDVTLDQKIDVSGHNYTWTVEHTRNAPLVEIRFDHFRVDTFTAPDKRVRDQWEFDLTNKNSFGNKPGVCTATPAKHNTGLLKNQPFEFTIRVCPTGAPKGRGQIRFRFADGTEQTIETYLPVAETFFAKNASLIGLGGLFGLYLLFKTIQNLFRRKKSIPTT